MFIISVNVRWNVDKSGTNSLHNSVCIIMLSEWKSLRHVPQHPRTPHCTVLLGKLTVTQLHKSLAVCAPRIHHYRVHEADHRTHIISQINPFHIQTFQTHFNIILPFCVCFVRGVSQLHLFRLKFPMQLSQSTCHYSSLVALATDGNVKNTHYEASHCAIFSNILLPLWYEIRRAQK